ncbi:MAG: DUF4855 domain-containing protein [Clostridia bacterium]|nr:DUF4855 domain-containing protein [Clostridia bacterium]
MKRIISLLITAMMLATALLCIAPSASAKVPTADDMDGYENVLLTYTFRYSSGDKGRHYEKDLLPYTAYLDKNGNIKDFFFDSYLFLPCMDYGPSGARMHLDEANPTKAIDWTAYVDDTFTSGANVDALEKAFGTTKSALGDTDSKAGVFFTLLYPGKNATNFGSLGGRSLNFSKLEDRKYALKWMIDEQIARFEQRGYKHLDLVGFYWLEEYVAADDDAQILTYAADYLHSKGLKFIWIPWYKANGYQDWKSYGFDVACMQPNLMWGGYNDPTRVNSSVALSERYGLSMEMECDGRVYTDDYFARYLNYLDGGLNSSMMDAVKMYYQDGKAGVYYQACYSNDPQYRMVYDLTYKYATKTLTQADIDSVRPEQVVTDCQIVDDIQRDSLMSPDVNWISVGKSYVGCRSYVDGNGADYQIVSGKELTDGIIASEPLSTDWHAFHHSLLDSEGRMSVTVDLGEQRDDLTHFYAHFDNRLEYGIGAPVSIELSVSDNGRDFRVLATPPLIMDATDSCIKYEASPVSARYVKLSFGPGGGNFVFCSELLVGIKDAGSTDDTSEPEASEPDTPTPDTSTPDEPDKDESTPDEPVSDGSNADESDNNESLFVESFESDESEQSDATSDDENSTDGNFVIPVVIAAVCVIAVAVTVIAVTARKKKK